MRDFHKPDIIESLGDVLTEVDQLLIFLLFEFPQLEIPGFVEY